jgi:glycosyltransferase involved in cell wall biosynthesis
MGLGPRDLELIEYLNGPAPAGSRFGVTRYLYDIWSKRGDLKSEFPNLDRDGAAFLEWARVSGRVEVPIIDELLPTEAPGSGEFAPLGTQRPWWGVNVVGHLTAEAGLGQAARLTIAALDACGVPLLPVEPALRPPTRHDHRFDTIPPAAASFPINIFQLSMLGLRDVRQEAGGELFEDRFTIAYYWWEVDTPLPMEWRGGLQLFDEAWAPSEYVRACIEPQISAHARTMPLPVEVPPPPAIARDRLGLPEGYMFMFIFDYGGTDRRKNPGAVVEAFKRTFAPGEGAALAIKCVNPEFDPEAHQRLLALAGQHPDIRVLDGYVASEQKDAMIAACDCYVSLHRSEGFGLTMAEAMYLGKPVIASRFSGNLDFMTDHNSHLVDCVPSVVGHGVAEYPPDAEWVEPSVDHAAALMRSVFDDPDGARELGGKAAEDIRRTHSPHAAGQAMRARLEEIAGWLAELDRAAEKHALIDTRAVAGLLARGPVGPRRPSAGARGVLSRLVLRAIRPYTAYQRQLDATLLETLEQVNELGRNSARVLARARRLELAYAHGRAAELRLARALARGGS